MFSFSSRALCVRAESKFHVAAATNEVNSPELNAVISINEKCDALSASHFFVGRGLLITCGLRQPWRVRSGVRLWSHLTEQHADPESRRVR